MLDSLIYDFIIINQTSLWLEKQILKICILIDKEEKNVNSTELNLLYKQLEALLTKAQRESRNLEEWIKRYEETSLLHIV